MKTLDQYRREANSENLKKLLTILRSPRSLIRGAKSPQQTIKFLKGLAEHFFDAKLKEPSADSQINLYRNSLRQLSALASGDRKTLTVEEFLVHPHIREWVSITHANELKTLFDHYGSDKASTHNYYLLYQPILLMLASGSGADKIRLLEIGLGTNNIDVQSNMGSNGQPGASVRAFRDYLPGAEIDGADVDRRILFSEERIHTFWVDQLSKQSLADLLSNQSYHLIIDDGLHTIEANLNTFVAAIEAVISGGWIIIEDISTGPDSMQVWLAMSNLVADKFNTFLVETSGDLVFLACKKPLAGVS
jgi:hypothetical protein